MSRKFIPPDDRDTKIRQLGEQLYFARRTIIDLVPEPLRAFLDAASYCETFEDLLQWDAWCIRHLIVRADLQPTHEAGAYRALCPLCGGSSQAPYSVGFSVPTGLSRHLGGTHGSARCGVFDAAYGKARDHVIEVRDGKAPRLQLIGHEPRQPPWRVDASTRTSKNVVKLRPD